MKPEIIYSVEVPKDQRSILDDTPESYVVEVPSNAPCCCIVYGQYGKRREANVSCRWLVRHLVEERARLLALITTWSAAVIESDVTDYPKMQAAWERENAAALALIEVANELRPLPNI